MNTNLDDFIPYQLSTASNAVSDLISSEYKSRFGLKIPEWRVMAVLGNRDIENLTSVLPGGPRCVIVDQQLAPISQRQRIGSSVGIGQRSGCQRPPTFASVA